MNGIVISVGHQGESATFQLHPESRVSFKERFPEARPVASVYISYQDHQDLSTIPDSTWWHIAQLLTNLSEAEIERSGGFEVVVPSTGRSIYRSRQADAA